jgi:hypothetical protein
MEGSVAIRRCLAHHSLAEKVFGAELVNAAVAEVTGDLETWGYTRKGNAVGLRAAARRGHAGPAQPAPERPDAQQRSVSDEAGTAWGGNRHSSLVAASGHS